MSTKDTKQDNIIFIHGKEKGLQALFSQEHFGYLALGFNQSNDTNGFINVEDGQEAPANGFYEISKEMDSTYQRVPLHLVQESNAVVRNYDNGEVTVKFMAEFDIDNIVSCATINQLAIVDTADPEDASTTFYAAATCDDSFNKSEQLAIVFIIEMTI